MTDVLEEFRANWKPFDVLMLCSPPVSVPRHLIDEDISDIDSIFPEVRMMEKTKKPFPDVKESLM
jgi:hypothetical protein